MAKGESISLSRDSSCARCARRRASSSTAAPGPHAASVSSTSCSPMLSKSPSVASTTTSPLLTGTRTLARLGSIVGRLKAVIGHRPVVEPRVVGRVAAAASGMPRGTPSHRYYCCSASRLPSRRACLVEWQREQSGKVGREQSAKVGREQSGKVGREQSGKVGRWEGKLRVGLSVPSSRAASSTLTLL
eukprot:scaffold128072_cov45-Phaeocystis_antarctica.AAC.1